MRARTKVMKPNPELFLDDHRGVYIPRDFAQCVKREQVSNVTPEQYAILENPEHDLYWDVWMEVCDDAVLTSSNGTTYTLYQDGALWLIPDGMEWDDKEDWWVWPRVPENADE